MQEIRHAVTGSQPDDDKSCGKAGLNDIWAQEDPAITGCFPSDEPALGWTSEDGEWR